MTSNLLRTLQLLFGFDLGRRRFYTFMASPKLPWDRLWPVLWGLIPQPQVAGFGGDPNRSGPSLILPTLSTARRSAV
jgi:hypothetical protein